MAIHDFPKEEIKKSLPGPSVTPEVEGGMEVITSKRDRIFSGAATRLFFLLLVIADSLWVCYAVLRLVVSLVGLAVTRGKNDGFRRFAEKAWVAVRRSLVCGVSLMVALFSPAFGIMIACTYFLMYDKTGIEEVIPASLQSQFKEFIPGEHNA